MYYVIYNIYNIYNIHIIYIYIYIYISVLFYLLFILTLFHLLFGSFYYLLFSYSMFLFQFFPIIFLVFCLLLSNCHPLRGVVMELRFYCVMRRSMMALFLEIEGWKIGMMSNFYGFFTKSSVC